MRRYRIRQGRQVGQRWPKNIGRRLWTFPKVEFFIYCVLKQMGNICKCKQFCWNARNSFFHKLQVTRTKIDLVIHKYATLLRHWPKKVTSGFLKSKRLREIDIKWSIKLSSGTLHQDPAKNLVKCRCVNVPLPSSNSAVLS